MLLGGGVWQGAGVGGGTVSTRVDVLVKQCGGGCGNVDSDGGSDSRGIFRIHKSAMERNK